MIKQIMYGLFLLVLLSAFEMKPRETMKGQIWADCRVYGTVVTPTELKAGKGPFDQLYLSPAGFKNGIMSISEAKPGDMDYNGGRWHVNELRPDVDPQKYANACSVEQLDPADFISTDTYFVCPLLPGKK